MFTELMPLLAERTVLITAATDYPRPIGQLPAHATSLRGTKSSEPRGLYTEWPKLCRFPLWRRSATAGRRS